MPKLPTFLPSLRTLLPPPSKMAWTCSATSNSGLIHNLQTAHQLRTTRVAAAMLSIDRAFFVPRPNLPYEDSPQPLSHNATISAPHMHATALELLAPHLPPGGTALDVGTGSGYLAACLAALAGPAGRVLALEHVPALCALAERNIRACDDSLLQSGKVVLKEADGRLGAPDYAPFHVIHVGAASPDVPQRLVEQLRPGGAMVIPVGEHSFSQRLLLVKKDDSGEVSQEAVLAVRYVPLCDLDQQVGLSS